MSRTEMANQPPIGRGYGASSGLKDTLDDGRDPANRGRGGVPHRHRASGYRPGAIPDRDPKPVDSRKR